MTSIDDNSTAIISLSSTPSDGILLIDFNRDAFLQVMLVYAAPCALALLCGSLSLYHSRFHMGLLPSWILRSWVGVASDDKDTQQSLDTTQSLASATGDIAENADATFEFYLSWLHPSAVILVLLVPIAIVVFFIAALILLDRMFAVAMAYLFFLTMLLCWTMMRWKFEAWRYTFKVKLLFLFAMATAIAFELYKAYYARPYTFIGLSVFCLMCNMLGMIKLAYYIREFKQLQFDKYLDIDKPLLVELIKQQEMAAVRAAEQASADKQGKGKLKAQQSAKDLIKATRSTQVESSDKSGETASTSVTIDPATGATKQLASVELFQKRLSLPSAIFAYLRAIATLVGFALIIDFASFGVIGYITAAAIVWLDFVVFAWVYGQQERTPLQACLLLSLIRFFMIIFGPTYYLVGHSCLFILISCYFSNELINAFAPLSKLRQSDDDEAEIVPEGVQLAKSTQAAAVKVEPEGSESTRAATLRRKRRQQRRSLHIAQFNVNSRTTQLISLTMLIIAFVFDTVLNYYIDDVRIPCGLYTTLPQCIVGFFALFVFVVFTFSKLTFRFYVNQQYKSHGWPQFLSLIHYIFVLGCGALYYWQAEEKNIPSLCIFLPPMIYFLIGLYSQWVKNDFCIILPASHRNPPKAGWFQALFRCGFPGNDYFMIFGIVIEMGLIIALGFALSCTPSWIGAVVSWSLVVLITSITPLVEYFHTFEFSLNMYVMTFISIASFLIGLILIFFEVLNGESGNAAFMLLLAGFLYPITITFIVGIAKWRDDNWVISDFVVWTNFISSMLLILLFFSIALVFTPWWIGGGLMFVFIILLLAIMILPKIKELSPYWYKLILTISAVLTFAFAVGATLDDSSGFVGFTVLCGIAFLALLGVIYYAYRGSPYDSISIHKHKLVLYSEHIFPIYEFDTMAKGRSNPLTEVNHRVWSIYGIFGVCYVWGVFALFFLEPTTVGLCVSSLAIVGAMLFTFELMHRVSVRNDTLADSIDYLEEGSDSYASVLSHCKWIATKNQFLNDTSLFISTQRNRMSADIGIQTEALTPHSLESAALQSIIDHLERVNREENWKELFARYEELSHATPKVSCCGMRNSYEVNIGGELVSRREAFRRCDELFLASAAFYQRHRMYQLNLQQELIKSVEGMQYDRLTQIIAMLRERGNFTITIEYLRSLPPLNPELERYEDEVDLWLEKRAKQLAELARIKAERDEDQRRRDQLAAIAAENARKEAEARAAEELRRKKEEMDAALKKREVEEEQAKAKAAAQLLEFEEKQRQQLADEQARAEQERLDEQKRKEEELREIERHRRIAEKRRIEQEIADGRRAAAEAAMAAKEQEELARLRRKAEQKQRELEHARVLAAKKAKLKQEAEMKAKMAELEAKHAAEMERVRQEQEEEAKKKKKIEDENARLEQMKAEVEARRLAHEQEMADIKRQMEEQAENMRKEKEKLEAARIAQEGELARLAAAETAAKERAAKVAAEEAQRRSEEEARRKEEEEDEERRKKKMEEQEQKRVEADRKRLEQKAKRQLDIEAAKAAKKKQLEDERAAEEAAKQEQLKKEMQSLVSKAQSDSCCTFKITSQSLVMQDYYACDTCGENMGGTCFCFQCAEVCHAGHELKKVGTAPCFCDCGHARQTCTMMKSASEQKAVKAKSQVSEGQSVTATTDTQDQDEEAEHPCVEIMKECKNRGENWVDPDFPHDDSSLFGGMEVRHPEWSGCKWERIRKICKGDPNLMKPPVDANDIQQGSIGNCWFMSACAVLTQKPEILRAVFVTKEYNEQGVYGLRFFKNGKIANVTVDDYLPTSERGNTLDALFSKPSQDQSIWVMLIEKAFAKLHRCYSNIEGGWIDDALVDLAGSVADRVRWEDEKTKVALHDGSLWTMLLKYYQQGFLLGCGSPVGTDDSEANASPFGIVQSHAYSVLSLVAVDDIQLIQVRNPWGRKEWTGDWGDKSPLWTRRMKSKVNYVDRDDGAFFMSWQDFCINFNEVYIARFYEKSQWPYQGKVFGEWRGVTAGGCINYETVKNNVQYGITLLDSGSCEVSVSLLQEDVRGKAGIEAGDFPVILVEIYDNKGKPITRRERGQQLASAVDNLQEIFVECTVQNDGNKTLTVLPCCFEQGVETSYTLKWYCTKRAKFQQFQTAESTENMVVETRRK